MAKDPAFLFYPNDYIGGTMGMTFDEKGAYMELLMMQFNRGHMSEHMIRQTVGQIWDNIQDKFTRDSEGKYFNERLEEEKLKRQNYTNSRRNNKSGANQHTKKTKSTKKNKGHMSSHMSSHMTAHMENENENENRVKDETEKPPKKEIIFPWATEDFTQVWICWKEYKKSEHKFNYKNIISEQAALNNLSKLSKGIEKDATQIIMNSVANGWKGFFELQGSQNNSAESEMDAFKNKLFNKVNNGN